MAPICTPFCKVWQYFFLDHSDSQESMSPQEPLSIFLIERAFRLLSFSRKPFLRNSTLRCWNISGWFTGKLLCSWSYAWMISPIMTPSYVYQLLLIAVSYGQYLPIFAQMPEFPLISCIYRFLHFFETLPTIDEVSFHLQSLAQSVLNWVRGYLWCALQLFPLIPPWWAVIYYILFQFQ